jgi:hypothetical protein
MNLENVHFVGLYFIVLVITLQCTKELEIAGIQDVRSKHKQNWINHLERMGNTRLPKHTLNYKLEEEEIVDALGNDGDVSMPEQVKRPNPWRKMMHGAKQHKISLYCVVCAVVQT